MSRTNGHKPLAKAADATAPLDDGDTIARLMQPYYRQLAELAFQDADAVEGIDVAFDLENAFVQTVLDQLAKNVRGVADTTKDEIRALVGRQAEEGWSSEELARAIRQRGIVASRSRALTISRTETGTAYNLGSTAAYRTAGVTHVSVLDGEDDEACAAANGQIWTLDEAEASPLGHPNCVRAFSPLVE